MSFESILKNDLGKEINKSEYRQNFKDRQNMSKSKMDEFSNVEYIGVNEAKNLHYTSELSKKYLAMTDLTYDIILSVFDVNSRALAVYRFYLLEPRLLAAMQKEVSSMKGPRANLEARIIGLQNNQDYYHIIDEFSKVLAENKIKLMEVDLFGGNKRHIAIDAKLGTSFNILMEDRLYRPGELANSLTMENFENTVLRKDKPKY